MWCLCPSNFTQEQGEAPVHLCFKQPCEWISGMTCTKAGLNKNKTDLFNKYLLKPWFVPAITRTMSSIQIHNPLWSQFPLINPIALWLKRDVPCAPPCLSSCCPQSPSLFPHCCFPHCPEAGRVGVARSQYLAGGLKEVSLCAPASCWVVWPQWDKGWEWGAWVYDVTGALQGSHGGHCVSGTPQERERLV